MDEMTTAELNQFLENIAKLIEATASDTESAAQDCAGKQGKGIKRERPPFQKRRSPNQEGEPGALPRPP